MTQLVLGYTIHHVMLFGGGTSTVTDLLLGVVLAGFISRGDQTSVKSPPSSLSATADGLDRGIRMPKTSQTVNNEMEVGGHVGFCMTK